MSFCFMSFTNLVFDYVDTSFVEFRIRDIYKYMLKDEYKYAITIINETMINLRHASVIDMDIGTYNKIYNEFYHMRIEMAAKKYTNVHDRMRDLHYYIRFRETYTDEISLCYSSIEVDDFDYYDSYY